MGYLLNGILLSHKKKKSLPFVTVWVGLENIMLSATSQSEKEIRISFHSYVESNEQTELTSRTKTDSEMESKMTARGGGCRGCRN